MRYSTYRAMILTTDLPSLRRVFTSGTDEAIIWTEDLGWRTIVDLSAQGMHTLLRRETEEAWSARPDDTATERVWYVLRGPSGDVYHAYMRGTE